ncbi:WD repeat domain-containing protein [Pseudomassariella vexata]|uniref:WD repeat domain-containing protein n=1 Tax=Pseudomassariella vexata TaxID=1141098 RepID=A0A1Y2E6C8_9PEZI|nr:WD repeat domain-containing protein [Pseudomassariella vexata]ORY67123.1 WD repeat domain-containing protein [Pseudomassariella vexata]
MTEGSPDLGDDRRRENDEPESESSAELVKIEPRPVEDMDEHKTDDESEDMADEGEEVAEEDGDEDDEDDEDDEPKLKYARLTQHLSSLYKNADMTSAFLVAGDKMVIGTHNGNINVIQLPMFQSLRVYHAHSTSVTSISISPYPPPLPPTTWKSETTTRAASITGNRGRASSNYSELSKARASDQRRAREPPQLPNIPSNNIHIATSSMDGNVCVQSLIDVKDVSLRNFARPVQAVALSPDYKNDKTYLSGGMAGDLVLTVGPPPGKSTSTTTGTAAAAAAGWLGSMGLGSNTGKDTVLHSGEGTINTIKWSLSGKFVVWLNEHGIKIMRTKLHLENSEVEDAWKRIGHIDRPQTDEWEEMAGVWKGRAEWIDEQAIERDEDAKEPESAATTASPAATKLKQMATNSEKKVERLIVGWGGTIWIIHVQPGGIGVGKNAGEKSLGKAEIAKKLRMDCIISGISLYTQNLLLVLAFCKPDEEDKDEDGIKKHAKGHKSELSTASTGSEPSGGLRRRQNAQAPELRLIDLTSQAEIDKDSLTVSRFERLSSNDYHIGVLPANNAASVVASRGVLDAMAGLGTGMWNAAINPRTLFNSGASIKSKDSNDDASSIKVASTAGSIRIGPRSGPQTVHPNLVKPGAKIFIHSPYDCILATKRDLGDHLGWLMERQRFEDAWNLLDEHPEIMSASPEKLPDAMPSSPDKQSSQPSSDDFYEDTASVIDYQFRSQNSSAENEKRRIGEQWIQELVEGGNWSRAAEVAAKVLNTSDRWEKWIYTFAGAQNFDEIVDYMPTEPMRPPIPGTVYEVILGHYIQNDRPRFKELLDRWDTELFDIHTIVTALENLLKYRDVREDSVEDGEKGRDWRIVMESLANLHEANGHYRDALKCYIKLQDADSTMRLIRDNHLADAVTDDVPSFIALRVPDAQLSKMTIPELDEATSEAITLLVDEGQRGLIKPDTVVRQLEKKDMNLYLYFYLRGLWNAYRERPMDESVSLVDDFADLAVRLFAMFDRDLLMNFFKNSTSYTLEKAAQECESRNYVPELVHLYSKTGEVKRALYLIIDRLGDVSQAISFAKEQDDPDLWKDLLDYSMDKPRFIRGLLEEVGTAIDPITLVRRIPEGLEIPGLREGLKHIMKEHEIQYSISNGVAKVLRSEVGAAQNMLRMGQHKGIKFEVKFKDQAHVDIEVQDVATLATGPLASPNASGTQTPTAPEVMDPTAAHTVTGGGLHGGARQQPEHDHRPPQPGHCARCHEPFTEWEMETLVGFACGHVFHISHLLEFLYPDQKPDPVIVDYWDGNEDRTRGGRFVRRKVTHARLLRDKVAAGCPVCRARMELVEGGA